MLSNIWVYKKTSKVMISLLLAAVLVLATQNWLLGLLMFIVTAAAVVWVKRSDLMQERLLMRYLDDLSSGVSVGTVYAVRNLPLGIAVVDEKKSSSGQTAYFVHGLPVRKRERLSGILSRDRK